MAVSLMHNGLCQLVAIVTDQGTHDVPEPRSSYGPQEQRRVASDLMTYAASLAWHSKAMDPTGLISMGERYYDPKVGRFISPDPIGLPVCVHLYSYAGGDPINYFDPTGRFFSPVYQPIKPALLKVGTVISDVWHNPRFQGATQAIVGLTEASAGGLATFGSGDLAAPLGRGVMAHGLDQFTTGMSTVITGKHRATLTEQMLQKTGMPPEWASLSNEALTIGGTMGASAIVRASRITTLPKIISSRGLTAIQERHLFSSSAKAYDKHLTRLAHSFSKHTGRHPETWGKLKGQ